MDLHPGSLGQYSVVRWTAPVSNSYLIAGFFVGIDPQPTTTEVHVLLNGVVVLSRKGLTFVSQ
jgi:hypothetical protein